MFIIDVVGKQRRYAYSKLKEKTPEWIIKFCYTKPPRVLRLKLVKLKRMRNLTTAKETDEMWNKSDMQVK